MTIIEQRTMESICSNLPRIAEALEKIANNYDAKPRCCLCGKPLEGMGNNADPVADGRCCDDCNICYVIPARIKAMEGGRK